MKTQGLAEQQEQQQAKAEVVPVVTGQLWLPKLEKLLMQTPGTTSEVSIQESTERKSSETTTGNHQNPAFSLDASCVWVETQDSDKQDKDEWHESPNYPLVFGCSKETGSSSPNIVYIVYSCLTEKRSTWILSFYSFPHFTTLMYRIQVHNLSICLVSPFSYGWVAGDTLSICGVLWPLWSP